MKNEVRSFSIKCESSTAEVIRIKKFDFSNKMLTYPMVIDILDERL